jgi:uncharacterized protein YpuA (DUF1002 family)
MGMKVTYRSAQLVSTKQYENRRIEYELSAELEQGGDLNALRMKLKRTVDSWILDDITELLYGGLKQQRVDEEAERRKLKRDVAKKYNIDFNDGYDDEGVTDHKAVQTGSY